MGRKIPSANDPSLSVPQTVIFSLLLAGMALVIAVSTTICGVRFRRKRRPSSSGSKSSSSESSSPSYKPSGNLNITSQSQSQSTSPSVSLSTSSSKSVASETGKEKQNIKECERKQVPFPPSKPLRQTFSCKNLLTKSASTRNLVKNMSMRLPRNMSMAKRDKEERNYQQKGKLKDEDSIWMKTIILGERCKVPDDDQEAAIYDSRGNRISTYHPKTPKSLPVSRQTSFTEPGEIPFQVRDKNDKIENELYCM